MLKINKFVRLDNIISLSVFTRSAALDAIITNSNYIHHFEGIKLYNMTARGSILAAIH